VDPLTSLRVFVERLARQAFGLKNFVPATFYFWIGREPFGSSPGDSLRETRADTK
jgi:hypothetical protein